MRCFRLCRRRFVRMFTLALFLGISFPLRPQTETLTPVPPDEVPQFGTFFSAQNWPPLPFDWLPSKVKGSGTTPAMGFQDYAFGSVITSMPSFLSIFILSPFTGPGNELTF